MTHTDCKLRRHLRDFETKVIYAVSIERKHKSYSLFKTRTKIKKWKNSETEANKMATYYAQYQLPQTYNFPVVITDWSPLVSAVQIPNIYTSPIHNIPVTIIAPQIITSLCPYTDTIIPPDPILVSMVPNLVVPDVPTGCYTEHLYSPEYKTVLNNYPLGSIVPAIRESDQFEYNTDENALRTQIAEAVFDVAEDVHTDPVEYYLNLPKSLFPSARKLEMDPNFIIDEFCKIIDISENVSWILDLEFGIPRVPVTRAIAVYDVKFNSVHCKNTPNAIHPGFEKCNADFKRVVVFYYDCILSTWYKGYIILNYDKSVENFQSWLLIPMQMFGMCWP